MRILETIPAQPGWRCAFAVEGPDPLRLVPVAAWAVVEGVPGAGGPEVCPMLEHAEPGRLPELRPVVHGLPTHCPPGYLGLVAPTEPLEPWRARAAGS